MQQMLSCWERKRPASELHLTVSRKSRDRRGSLPMCPHRGGGLVPRSSTGSITWSQAAGLGARSVSSSSGQKSKIKDVAGAASGESSPPGLGMLPSPCILARLLLDAAMGNSERR